MQSVLLHKEAAESNLAIQELQVSFVINLITLNCFFHQQIKVIFLGGYKNDRRKGEPHWQTILNILLPSLDF